MVVLRWLEQEFSFVARQRMSCQCELLAVAGSSVALNRTRCGLFRCRVPLSVVSFVAIVSV